MTLQDAIFSTLSSGYYLDENGKPIDGQSVSYAKKDLHEKGWTGLGGCLGDFEYLCRQAGFKIVKGRNVRGNAARIITL